MAKANNKKQKQNIKNNNSYFKFEGTGRIIFKDNAEYSVNFEINLLSSGATMGALFFTKYNSNLEERFKKTEKFDFEGIDKEKTKMFSKNCIMFAFEQIQIKNFDFPLYKARFYLNEIEIFEDLFTSDKDIKYKDILIEFGITDFFVKTEIVVDTEMGSLLITSNIDEHQYIINKYSHIPFISSVGQLKLNKCDDNLDSLLLKLNPLILKILEVLSFSKLASFQCIYIKLFRIEKSKFNFLYTKINHVLPKITVSHDFVSPNDLKNFINHFYQNYNDDVNIKYNFSLALKWFLESLTLKPNIINFVNASTALESIINKFYSKDDFIINPDIFNSLCAEWKKLSFNLLGEENSQALIINKNLNNINRKSYRFKTKKLLQELKIWNKQIETGLGDIIRIRNFITHTGNVPIEDKEKLIITYFKLIDILLNLFLKIFSYKEVYSTIEYREIN